MSLNKKFCFYFFTIFFILFSYSIIFANEVTTILYYENPDVKQSQSTITEIEKAIIQSKLNQGVLIEKKGGETYATLTFNFYDNVKNLKIYIKNNEGNYNLVDFDELKNEDTMQYKFKIDDTKSYILVDFYTAPFGRNLKFYLSINSDDLYYLDNHQSNEGEGDKNQSNKVYVTKVNEEQPDTEEINESSQQNIENEGESESEDQNQEIKENNNNSTGRTKNYTKKSNKTKINKTSKTIKSFNSSSNSSNFMSFLVLIILIGLFIWIIVLLGRK